MIVSGDDFVVSSHVDQDSFCKFRVDHYYIAAWETPENFMKGVDQYADNGFTSFIGCGQNIQSIEGERGRDIKPADPQNVSYGPFPPERKGAVGPIGIKISKSLDFQGDFQKRERKFLSFSLAIVRYCLFSGVACCNGYLRYVMTRAIDETTKGNYRWTNTDSVARVRQHYLLLCFSFTPSFRP